MIRKNVKTRKTFKYPCFIGSTGSGDGYDYGHDNGHDYGHGYGYGNGYTFKDPAQNFYFAIPPVQKKGYLREVNISFYV